MALDYQKLTEILMERLNVELPPVAMTWVAERPAQVQQTGKESPSFCSFWRWGEQQTFYAAAEQALGCPLGGMVAGFPLPDDRRAEAHELLAEFCEAEGDHSHSHDEAALMQEIEQTARVTKPASGVVTGPLWEFPLAADVVLVWGTIIQAAVLQEAVGPLMWKNNPQGAVFTRPSCSVLPIAMLNSKPAMSLGCAGMRAYTGIPENLFLVALPGDRLEQIAEGLLKIEDPADRMRFYEERLRAGMAQQQQQQQGG